VCPTHLPPRTTLSSLQLSRARQHPVAHSHTLRPAPPSHAPHVMPLVRQRRARSRPSLTTRLRQSPAQPMSMSYQQVVCPPSLSITCIRHQTTSSCHQMFVTTRPAQHSTSAPQSSHAPQPMHRRKQHRARSTSSTQIAHRRPSHAQAQSTVKQVATIPTSHQHSTRLCSTLVVSNRTAATRHPEAHSTLVTHRSCATPRTMQIKAQATATSGSTSLTPLLQHSLAPMSTRKPPRQLAQLSHTQTLSRPTTLESPALCAT
jgi:hypothetical protein